MILRYSAWHKSLDRHIESAFGGVSVRHFQRDALKQAELEEVCSPPITDVTDDARSVSVPREVVVEEKGQEVAA